MNRGSILLFLFLCVAGIPAAAEQIRSGDSLTINVSVTVVNPEDYGLTNEQMEALPEVHSLGWDVKQCCLQQRHRLGMQSAYCFEQEVQERLQYCSVYLK